MLYLLNSIAKISPNTQYLITISIQILKIHKSILMLLGFIQPKGTNEKSNKKILDYLYQLWSCLNYMIKREL